MPDDWVAENVACLLHTMGFQLTTTVVISKAVNGHCSDLATTLTSMSLVAVKLRCSLNPILLLIEKACKATRTDRNRRIFLDHLARSFQEVIVDLYEADDIGKVLYLLFPLRPLNSSTSIFRQSNRRFFNPFEGTGPFLASSAGKGVRRIIFTHFVNSLIVEMMYRVL